MFNPEGLQSSAAWAQHIPQPNRTQTNAAFIRSPSIGARRYGDPARRHSIIRYSELQTGISYRHNAVNPTLQARTGPQMIRIRASFLIAILSAAPLGFAQRGAPIEQQLTFTPYHASGIYDIGETVGWTVTPGPATPTFAYKWTIRRNNAVVLKEGKLDLSSGKDKIEIAGDQPEMIYVAIEPYANLAADASATDAASPAAQPSAGGAGRGAASGYVGGNTGRNNGLYAVGAAVAPARIGLSTPRPDRVESV